MWRGAKPADCSSRCKRLLPFMHSYMVMPEAARYRLKQRSAAHTYNETECLRCHQPISRCLTSEALRGYSKAANGKLHLLGSDALRCRVTKCIHGESELCAPD